MKKVTTILLIFLFNAFAALADEGMWLPQLLQSLNESRMKSLGMKITAEDIYSIKKSSLKDAIVSFGGFCTGEVISDKGLVLTNHHCGFDNIQKHTTIEKNYIRNGFWAKNFGEELPNPGLFVTFIVKIDEVTNEILKGVPQGLTEKDRKVLVDKNLDDLRTSSERLPGQDVLIRSFYEGNKYFRFITETFRDIRLVGAPPSSIGKFGEDTDNWVWPRHAADFSMFRIYANRNNEPAAYSPDNVPYKPRRSLKISLSGVKEKDFTMVFGFPGVTQQYLPAVAVEQIRTVSDPAKIAIRDKALKAMKGFMQQDEAVKIKYASKYARVENSYKKWKGEVLGLTATNAFLKKKNYEKIFQQRVDANPLWKKEYGSLLAQFDTAYKNFESLSLSRDIFTETTARFELYRIALELNKLITAFEKNGDSGYQKTLPAVKRTLAETIKDLDVNVDKALFESLIPGYVNQPANSVSPDITNWLTTVDGSIPALTNKLYSQKGIYDTAYLFTLLEKPAPEAVGELKKLDAINLFKSMEGTYLGKIRPGVQAGLDRINELQRSYMKAQMEVMKDKKFYPDANGTLRVTYGQVEGYRPKDAVHYTYHTDLDGVMEKYIPGDYEFDVPEKLRLLHQQKDYGRYAINGVLPVCFIASNHTTGGNSGSPALDAYGNVIGLNFDRVWEGTMSDINYDASICRNIMVDIRYILFIVDKFAGATNIIEELSIVYPKVKG